MARSGNAADQAVLLAALLTRSGIACRFARGPIDESTADAILGSALIGEAEARQEFVDAITGTGEGSRPMRAEDMNASGAAVDPAAVPTPEVLDWANERLAMMVATVEGSLAAAGIALPSGSTAIRTSNEATTSGSRRWLVRRGSTSTRASQAPSWAKCHRRPYPTTTSCRTTCGIDCGSTSSPRRSRTDPWSRLRRSRSRTSPMRSRTSRSACSTSNASGSRRSGRRSSPVWKAGRPTSHAWSSARPSSWAPARIRFGGTGGPFDVVAAGTPGPREGEPIAQWLQVTISSPGRAERVVRRPIFDRIGPAARSAGPVDLAAIQPAELVQLRPGLPDYMPARRTHWVTVHTGTLGGQALGEALNRQDRTSALVNLPRSFQVFREAGGLELGVPNGMRTFVDGPDLVGVTVDQRFEEGRVASGLSLDIWHRSLAAHPVADVVASADGAVLAGVLPHLIERLMAGEASRDVAERPAASVGSLFEAAAREGIATIVLRDMDRIDALPFAPDAIARLRSALSAGLVAIVPERPPDSTAGRVGWWLVDPTTGRTVDEMDDGRGTVDQYAATVRVTVVETAGPMQDLGICAGIRSSWPPSCWSRWARWWDRRWQRARAKDSQQASSVPQP